VQQKIKNKKEKKPARPDVHVRAINSRKGKKISKRMHLRQKENIGVHEVFEKGTESMSAPGGCIIKSLIFRN